MSRREEVELEKSVRRLREQFHGKIAVNKAAVLMRRFSNNHRLITNTIILMKDSGLDDEDEKCLKTDAAVRNVVQKLEAEEQERAAARRKPPSPQPAEDKDVQELAEQLLVLPLTQKNVRMFNDAQQNLFPSVLHQFACQSCDLDWWRRVPARKRVSRCNRCKRKYDPVPVDKMWGMATFHCPTCTRFFRGFGRMDLGSPCYLCRSLVTPTEILAPLKRLAGLGPRKRNQHSCLAEDCYNRQEPHVPGTECVHPRSRVQNRKPRVVNPSPGHISSGSTVNTCLSQGSVADLYQLILSDITETHEEEEERASNSSSDSPD